jgi:hypothetical protein
VLADQHEALTPALEAAAEDPLILAQPILPQDQAAVGIELGLWRWTGSVKGWRLVGRNGSNPCTCSLVLRSTMMMVGGPWSTSGNILSQGSDVMEYCVQGNDLFIRTPMSMGVMGEASVSARLTRR